MYVPRLTWSNAVTQSASIWPNRCLAGVVVQLTPYTAAFLRPVVHTSLLAPAMELINGFGSPGGTGRLVCRTAARGGPKAEMSAKSSIGIRLWTARGGMLLLGTATGEAALGLTASAATAESRRQRAGEIRVQRVKNSTENSIRDDRP